MPSKERKPDAVGGYGYFRLLQALREQGAVPRAENDTSLAFPPGDIAACAGDAVRPAFMGLLGAAGALPYHYTERIARAPGSGPREFLDMLSARALEQFDAAWYKHRPADLLPMLMALGGTREPALAQYAAMMRRSATSAEAVGKALSDYFGVPLHVEQFAGSWQLLAPPHRNALGRANATLGSDTALGARQWRCDLGINIHIGPLDAAAREQFLPRSPAAKALPQMLAAMMDGCIEAVAHVQLESIGAAALDARARLGYDALLARAGEGELCYKIGYPE